MVAKGFLTKAPDATRTNRGWEGRIEAEAFLSEIGERFQPGSISLVIGVALFYGSILEEGAPPLRKKYRVLANIETDLRELAQFGVRGVKYKAVYNEDAENSIVYRIDKNL